MNAPEITLPPYFIVTLPSLLHESVGLFGAVIVVAVAGAVIGFVAIKVVSRVLSMQARRLEKPE